MKKLILTVTVLALGLTLSPLSSDDLLAIFLVGGLAAALVLPVLADFNS